MENQQKITVFLNKKTEFGNLEASAIISLLPRCKKKWEGPGLNAVNGKQTKKQF